jgi:hypothetical protein
MVNLGYRRQLRLERLSHIIGIDVGRQKSLAAEWSSTRAHETARPKRWPPCDDESKSIEHDAYGSLDGDHVMTAHTVQEPSRNQPVDVRLAHLNRIATKTTLPALP